MEGFVVGRHRRDKHDDPRTISVSRVRSESTKGQWLLPPPLPLPPSLLLSWLLDVLGARSSWKNFRFLEALPTFVSLLLRLVRVEVATRTEDEITLSAILNILLGVEFLQGFLPPRRGGRIVGIEEFGGNGSSKGSIECNEMVENKTTQRTNENLHNLPEQRG